MPLITICIPAYKRVNYLQRLLDSISIQTFRDFDVVITDDSPDDSVRNLVQQYRSSFPIFYHHNSPAKGTPANWNEGISHATGDWIKLIHDDDWFATKESLGIFAKHAGTNSKLIFSAYANCIDGQTAMETKRLGTSWKDRITKEPMTLLAYNVIGPPSVTMVHSSVKDRYDERMKWRVDMDYYVELLLKDKSYTYIDEVLINVGISTTQVTNECFQNPSVELPEGFLLLQKYGSFRLRNIWVYDAWWRLLRNMQITSEQQLQQYPPAEWPQVIVRMVSDLRKMPAFVLKFGPFSKFAMFVSWLTNQPKAN